MSHKNKNTKKEHTTCTKLKTSLLILAMAWLLMGCPSNAPLNQMQVAAKKYAELSHKYRIIFTGYNYDSARGMNVTFSCECQTKEGEPIVFLIKVNAGHPAQRILQRASVSEEFKFNYSEERLDQNSEAPESSGSHLQFISQKGGLST